MIDRFIHIAQKDSESTAIIVADKKFTYKQLYRAALAVAENINGLKESGHFVGLYTDNNFYTYAGILGIMLVGKAFVPLNSKFPDDRLKNIMDQAGIKNVVSCRTSYDKIKQIDADIEIVIADELDEVQTTGIIKNEGIAYILFTSGSTGTPKGIPITNENFSCFLDSLIRKYPLNNTNKVLQCFELSFDVSIACTFLAFSTGATLVVSPLDGIVAVNAFKTILDHQVDFVCIAPSAISYLKNYKLVPQFKLPFVKSSIFTGEALPFDAVELWKQSAADTVIYNAYGPTEVTVWSYFYQIDDNTEKQLINGLCPIGLPLEGVQSKIEQVEDTMEHTGELVLGGKHVFNAYWNNSEKTKETLSEDESERRWYRTGDLVKKNTEGNVVYINRLDNQVKFNGYRIELGEIEYAIKKLLPGSNVAVILSNDKKGNQQLIGYTDAEINNKEELLKSLRQSLTFYMIPKEIYHLKSMPLNSNGKIDRVTLKSLKLHAG